MDIEEKYRKLHQQVSGANTRARQLGLPATITDGQLIASLRYWGWKCAVCKRQETTLNMDHWIPLSAASCPGSVIENLVPLCHGCNNSKKDRNGDMWLERKLSGSDLDETRSRLGQYQSTITDLPTDDMTISDFYVPQSVTVRRRRTNIEQVNLRLDLDDPEQCRLWEYYQKQTHRGKGSQWVIKTLIKALPPDSND